MRKEPIHTVHFIGIGGVGMSGIARVAHDQGMVVTGSDLKESRYTKQLREAGIFVDIGHLGSNLPQVDPDVVVVSTAILDNNPELIVAKERGLEIWHRAKMLAQLGVGKKTLAVAGTHGKTTTSSMLASVLDTMGEDPSFLIGGIVRDYQTNARSGKGEYYVVEADESDKSFTYLDPCAMLITNIEVDHLDHYNDLDEIYSKFEEFIESVGEKGICVVCGEDKALVDLARKTPVQVFSYGFGSEFDISISDYKSEGVGSSFTCTMPDGEIVPARVLQNPGRHNVLNAAGVLALIWAIGFPPAKAAEALASFCGVKRRFDVIGEEKGITVVDDYAHHPTEIAVTITAAKKLGFDRVHVLFQPHRYSRAPLFTETLKDEFGHAFDEADSVMFMDVYPAGETPIPGISGKTFMDILFENEQHPETVYVPRRIEVVPYLISTLNPGDLIITMGAGDVTAIGPELLDALAKTRV